LDIVRSLPDGTAVDLSVKSTQVRLRCGSGRFTLAALADEDFPTLDEIAFDSEFHMSQGLFRDLLEKTHFAMAQQDVRYYLNGLYVTTDGSSITAVATDGHRLALSEIAGLQEDGGEYHVIVPRKGVQELLRLLEVPDAEVLVQMGTNHLRIWGDDFRFTSRLIDGRFPDYRRVVPAEATNPLLLDRQLFRDALSRTAILSNEKYRGVRLRASAGALELLAHNPENEEAEERLEVEYDGPDLEVGFNVTYLLDALGAIHSELVKLFLFDANSSCLIRASDSEDSRYVVMPMRL
jgi:DNA polymerase-3 subunit beta